MGPTLAASRTKALADARQEYAAAAKLGRAGRDVQARYTARLDTLVQQLAEAASATTPAPPLRLRARRLRPALALACTPTSTCSSSSSSRSRQPTSASSARCCSRCGTSGLTVGQHVRELAIRELDDARYRQSRVPAVAARPRGSSPATRGSSSASTAWLRGHRASNTAGALLDAAAAADRRAPRAVQRHGLPARARHQERAGRPARHRRRASHPRCSSPARSMREPIASARPLQDAEDFLQRVRSLLHLESGRDVNVLSHDLQEKVAEAFGCEGRQAQQRVETLMGEYFRHARAASRALARTRRIVAPPPARHACRATSDVISRSPRTACASWI